MKGLLNKPTGEQVQKALALELHTTYLTGGRYQEIQKNHSDMRAFTIAAFIAAGMINLSAKTSVVTAGKNPMIKRFNKITGGLPAWNKERIADGKITKKGIDEIDASLKGQRKSRSCTRQNVDLFLKGIQTGADVKIEKRVYKMKAKINA